MRWGLVGTGPWARTVHAPSLAHTGARLITVWGRDPAKAAALAEAHGVRASASLDALLEQVDAVSFAIAPQAQAPLAARALARGRHVLLEKPVATEPDVARRLAQQAPAGSAAVVFLTRLFEPTRAAWLRVAAGGDFTSAHVEWVSSALVAGSVYADSAWRRGSGIVWDLMPHVLSQLVPVLGEVVEARGAPWPERDGMLVELDHDGGRRSLVRMTLQAAPDQRAEWIRFEGPAGTTTSPRGALDFVAAHRRAVQAVEAGTALEEDPLLRAATVVAAARATELMSSLVSTYERDLDPTRAPERRVPTDPL